MIYKLYVRFKDRWEPVASSYDPDALTRLAKLTRCNSFNHKIVADHKTNKLAPGKKIII